MNLFMAMVLRLLILGGLGGAAWYTPRRLAQLVGRQPRWPLTVLGLGIVFGSITGMLGVNRSTSALVGDLGIAAGLLFALFLYTTLLLIALNGIRRLGPLPERLTAGVAVGLALALTIVGAWQANDFVVSEVEIPITGLAAPVSLMHISDAHIGHHRGGDYLERLVAETNHHRPDLVLLNGDLVDSDAALVNGGLTALADFETPAYFTTGNHEHYVEMQEALEIIAGHGVRILHNAVVQIQGLQLVGMDYMNADENTFDMHAVNHLTLKAELPKLPLIDTKPVILLHHSPVGLDYVAAAGVDLMLAGHTHAGQIFPATLLNHWIFPLNKGVHRHGDTMVLVSQGAGTFGPRMRLGSRNEINLIRLLPAPAEEKGPSATAAVPLGTVVETQLEPGRGASVPAVNPKGVLACIHPTKQESGRADVS